MSLYNAVYFGDATERYAGRCVFVFRVSWITGF